MPASVALAPPSQAASSPPKHPHVQPYTHTYTRAQYGDYRVPLDLADAEGRPLALTLSVVKTVSMQ